MSPLTTHVLDTAAGHPAEGIVVVLERLEEKWTELSRGTTNADGRLPSLLPDGNRLTVGTYRLRFLAGTYFQARGQRAFYDEIPVQFVVEDVAVHYHVPLLLSPFGYSTYRGS